MSSDVGVSGVTKFVAVVVIIVAAVFALQSWPGNRPYLRGSHKVTATDQDRILFTATWQPRNLDFKMTIGWTVEGQPEHFVHPSTSPWNYGVVVPKNARVGVRVVQTKSQKSVHFECFIHRNDELMDHRSRNTAGTIYCFDPNDNPGTQIT